MVVRALALLIGAATVTGAQARLSPAELERRMREYLADSVLIDTISRVVPTDSLRTLYRALPRTRDPIAALKELRCESFRLWRQYGYGARLAEYRLRAEEWGPDTDAAVRAVFDSARFRTYPHEAVCGVAPDEPRVIATLRYPPANPRSPRFLYPAGFPLDSMRAGASFFEGEYRWYGRGRDTTLSLAGSAQMEFTTGALSLVLDDRSRPGVYGSSVTFYRPGREYLARGSYPILGHQDAFGIPGTVAVFNHIRQALGFPEYDMPDRVWGTLFVDQADTNGATGRLEMWIAKTVLTNVSGTRTPVFDSIPGDTIAFTARFRAAFLPEREKGTHVLAHMPQYPHRVATGPAPDARKTSHGLFLDERRACESLPIWSADSRIDPLPPGSRETTAAIEVRIDTIPRPHRQPMYVEVLSISDRTHLTHVRKQKGLVFRPRSPGQVHTLVRCTLTLRAP